MNTVNKVKFNSNELQSVSQSILQEAKRLGADQAEVSVAANKGFTVKVSGGDVETIEYHQDKIIEINVFYGNVG